MFTSGDIAAMAVHAQVHVMLCSCGFLICGSCSGFPQQCFSLPSSDPDLVKTFEQLPQLSICAFQDSIGTECLPRYQDSPVTKKQQHSAQEYSAKPWTAIHAHRRAADIQYKERTPLKSRLLPTCQRQRSQKGTQLLLPAWLHMCLCVFVLLKTGRYL